MKFYLESTKDLGPYDDLKTNRLMRNHLQKIEKETDAKVTFEDAHLPFEDAHLKGYQHIIVDIPSMKALAQIMEAIGKDLVIEQRFAAFADKYPTICICDGCIEQEHENENTAH